jgi:F-type H+-transporting ATPase subunit epsilon
MANTLRLEIVTPDAKTFDADVDMVVLPGVEGEMGVYPMHVPFMTRIKPGELRVLQRGQENAYVVGDGFVEITQTHVSVLTDMALQEAGIDEEAVQKAIERAEAALREKQGLDDEEIATVTASLERSLAQLRFKRRKQL